MNLYSTTYQFKHIYDLDRLKEYSRYAQNDIQRALDYIEKVKQYQREIYEHAQIVASSTFEHVVMLERSTDYSTNKKHYNVTLHNRPKGINEVDHHKVYGTYSEHKHFEGKERHSALKYAEELATRYNCTIEKKGFPRRSEK